MNKVFQIMHIFLCCPLMKPNNVDYLLNRWIWCYIRNIPTF